MAENKQDDQQHAEQHPNQHTDRSRASLRGKGRKILLGQHADLFGDDELVNPDQAREESEVLEAVNADALPLTPEETEALLDFPESLSDIPLSEPASLIPAAPEPPTDLPAWWEDSAVSLLDETDGGDYGPITERPDHPEPESIPARGAPKDAIPLAESTADPAANRIERVYQAHPEVDKLNPREPEIWWTEPEHDPHEQIEHEGGVIVPEGAVIIEDPVPVGLPEPFEPVYERQPAKVLFEKTEPSDLNLLHLLVDDAAIRKLAQQIEALQFELTEHVRSDRDSADVYMNELLRASGLLMASRENYDDAKAIVFRVRADMKREEKVDTAIKDYRPMLLLYYTCWGIALGVLFLLKALFVGITDAVGVEAFAAMYNPMLFGIAGALISGYLTLERHTTKLRDFDPVHVSWYLFNPLLGAVMGLIMFLIAAIANEDLLQDAGSTAERAITYLLCVVAGMNQNTVLRQLNNLLERVKPGNGK